MPKITIELDVEEGAIGIKPIAVIFTMDAKNSAGDDGFHLGGTVVGDFPVTSMRELNKSADVVRRVFFRMFASRTAGNIAGRN